MPSGPEKNWLPRSASVIFQPCMLTWGIFRTGQMNGSSMTRKPGKLPSQTIQQSYSLEYGDAAIEVHTDSISKGEQVLILDDLLATGGTASAAVELVRRLGGNIAEVAFVIELSGLKGREKLPDVPVFSLLQYD